MLRHIKRHHHLIALAGLIGGLVVGVALHTFYSYFENNYLLPQKTKQEAKSEVSKSVRTKPIVKKITQTTPIRVPIIMYHYVEYVKDPLDTTRRSLSIPPNMFDAQLRDLAENGYTSYFVKDMKDMIEGEHIPSKKSVVLTFDDGYEDFYTDALPILKRYHTKATLYVIYNYIGREGFLSREQINKIINSGLVEIGAHTLDHFYLKAVPRPALVQQIHLSKKYLEDTFDIPVYSFAYPYGAFDEAAVEAVAEASYSAAVSTVPGIMHESKNIFFMPRIRSGALGFYPSSVLKVYGQ